MSQGFNAEDKRGSASKTKEALSVAKSRGVKLGNPKGVTALGNVVPE